MSLQDRLEFTDIMLSDPIYVIPKTVHHITSLYHFMEIAYSQNFVVKKMV